MSDAFTPRNHFKSLNSPPDLFIDCPLKVEIATNTAASTKMAKHIQEVKEDVIYVNTYLLIHLVIAFRFLLGTFDTTNPFFPQK